MNYLARIREANNVLSEMADSMRERALALLFIYLGIESLSFTRIIKINSLSLVVHL